MFQILDGREHFYQWDIDRKIIVLDEDITEVHFCNRTDDCSLVCEVYSIDGIRLVNVPNILLQNDWRINVYAYDKNYTKHSECFKVVKRSKPTDYIYTETEIKRYGDLEERISALEEGNIDIDIDLEGYATQEYVDNAISNIELTPGPTGPKGDKGDKGDAGAPGKDAPQESVLYIPQELTEDQKAQALANLGLDELPTGDNACWKLAAETTTTERVNTITLDTSSIPPLEVGMVLRVVFYVPPLPSGENCNIKSTCHFNNKQIMSGFTMSNSSNFTACIIEYAVGTIKHPFLNENHVMLTGFCSNHGAGLGGMFSNLTTMYSYNNIQTVKLENTANAFPIGTEIRVEYREAAEVEQ